MERGRRRWHGRLFRAVSGCRRSRLLRFALGLDGKLAGRRCPVHYLCCRRLRRHARNRLQRNGLRQGDSRRLFCERSGNGHRTRSDLRAVHAKDSDLRCGCHRRVRDTAVSNSLVLSEVRRTGIGTGSEIPAALVIRSRRTRHLGRKTKLSCPPISSGWFWPEQLARIIS